MADIFEEVDEELRQERVARLWKRYGKYVIAAAVALVVAVGGYRYWNDYQRSEREALAARYEAAVATARKGETDAAIAELGALLKDGGPGYAALARLQQAAIAAGKGDIQAALLAYEQLAADAATPAPLRGLARYLAVLHRIGKEDPAGLIKSLEPILGDDEPWRYLALELKAILTEKSGDRAEARRILAQLSDDQDAPARLRGRAAELLKAWPQR